MVALSFFLPGGEDIQPVLQDYFIPLVVYPDDINAGRQLPAGIPGRNIGLLNQ